MFLQHLPCSCGMIHTCDIQHIHIRPGALSSLPEVTGPYHHILLVADENTYPICGDAVCSLLSTNMEATVILRRKGLLVPNETAIDEVQKFVSKQTDLILGIGSGVIQDLCKYVSYEADLPYQIIATAPSMDGYASKGAAMILNNMKVTCATHVPEAIIADVDILKDAPIEMIQAGYGDILGKFSCLNDWKLSAVIQNEYFCQTIYDMVETMLKRTKDLGPSLLQRDPSSIQTLMESLIGVGVAMAYIGNSRPASGSEHHLSHYFEITGLLHNADYFCHGIDVAYSAVYTQRLREQLLSLKEPVLHHPHDPSAWSTAIRRIYAHAAEGIFALQKQLGWYEEDRIPIYQDKWDQIRSIFQDAPSSQTMIQYLKSVGLDIAAFDRLYGTEKINQGIFYAKDLKDRYSVLWLYYDLMS